MTIMAETNPALFRLFERIDASPNPGDSRLQGLLKAWQAARLNTAIPSLTAFLEPKDGGRQQKYCLFAFNPEYARDYDLLQSSSDMETFLGVEATGMRLTEAPRRRAAVRLRRLLDLVRASGEPLLARFETTTSKTKHVVMEIFVAPLSEDGRTVTCLVCGLSTRSVKGAPAVAKHSVRREDPMIFAPGASALFAEAVAGHLDLTLSPLEERNFEDGEHKIRPLVEVRNRHAVLIACLNASKGQSVNDRLCRFLFLVSCLKTNGAASVLVVTPYLSYMRKDRQTKEWDPLTGRYVAQLIESAGADVLITMETHNLAAFQNAFRIPTVHLNPYKEFADVLVPELLNKDVTVMSPDLGGSKRADLFREVLEGKLGRPVGAAVMEKHRSAGIVSGELFAGEVGNRAVVVLDDMISSGGTMARAAAACGQRGAESVYLLATHGLLTQEAQKNLSSPTITRLLLTNTVDLGSVSSSVHDRLTSIDVTETIANAIRSCVQ